MYLWMIFLNFLKLGLYAFGGPAAHLLLFHRVLVQQKHWLTDTEYSQLLALAQLLPGPTSSQVGLGIGYLRGGYAGALLAWLGFSLPSVLIMLAAALWLQYQDILQYPQALQGLQLIVLAVVILALWQMVRSFCSRPWQYLLLLLCSALLLLWSQPAASVLVLGIGAGFGLCFAADKSTTYSPTDASNTDANQTLSNPISPPQPSSNKTSTTTKHIHPMVDSKGRGASIQQRAKAAQYGAVLFLVLFLVLFGLAALSNTPLLEALSGFYQTGALVFGGGHVVLPLLAQEFVTAHAGAVHLNAAEFHAGYALAQLLPGPLFSFAAYVGALLPLSGSPVIHGLLATLAMFLPGMLLLLAAIPHWTKLMAQQHIQRAVLGMNAAVVSLLLVLVIAMAQKYLSSLVDVLMVLITLLLLKTKCPVWLSLPSVWGVYVWVVPFWHSVLV